MQATEVSKDPLIFISHKHSDRDIAEAIARFVKNRTAGHVRVHLSSSPDFEGPRFGAPLNDELKRALGEADAVILVFTTDSEDWSYCMWECGVATDPGDDRPTAVVVVQCTSAEPKPFADQLRVDARNLDSVQGFVKALLTTNDVFAGRDQPVTGFSADGTEVKEAAAELHAKLAEVIPSGGGVESTPSAPFLQVHLPAAAAEECRAASLSGVADLSHKVLETAAVITNSVGASDLFGMQLHAASTLGDVLADWREDEGASETEARWFLALVEQVEAALAGKLRPVKWAPYRTVQGRADVPFVAASRQVTDGVEFDVYMVPIAPRPISVAEKMMTLEQMYVRDGAVDPFGEIQLTGLVKEMKDRKVTRLPLLMDRAPHAIVHKATINEFIVQRLEDGDVDTLTLHHLLAAHGDALADSFAEVPPDATVEDAMDAMAAKPGAQDVYVVKDGEVVGWLTNVMFIQD